MMRRSNASVTWSWQLSRLVVRRSAATEFYISSYHIVRLEHALGSLT